VARKAVELEGTFERDLEDFLSLLGGVE